MGPHTLKDGTKVIIRPIRPSDAPLLQSLHARLSPESRYFRFFNPHPILSCGEASNFATVDYELRMAFVATHEEGGEEPIIGVARYATCPQEPQTAEAAVVVEDRFQGRGLGTLLIKNLTAYALAHGIERFTSQISAENYRMLKLIRECGEPIATKIESGVCEIQVRLQMEPSLAK